MLGIATDGYWCLGGAAATQGGGGALGGVPGAPGTEALVPQLRASALPPATAKPEAPVVSPKLKTDALAEPSVEVKPLRPQIGNVDDGEDC